ncbi:MAG: Abi family protein [Bacteroidota bacterium]
MRYTKPPITLPDQVSRLKSRGLRFVSDTESINQLSNISYYRLRAYTYPFQDNSDPNHPFTVSVTFEQIIELYQFDRRLSQLVFNALEKIEIAMRTQIIYIWAITYGSHWQNDPSLYRDPVKFANQINTLHSEIDRSHETFIDHYKNSYTIPPEPPCWMSLEVSAKRKEMLNLALSEYKRYREIVVKGFIKASKILVENHIYNYCDIPYSTQLIPMAAILARLGNQIDNLGNKNKLMRWFWCGVFGELYGSANETRYALDLLQVPDWILNNGDEPKTIYDANFSPSRLHTLRTRNSAAYKGVYALLLDENTKDWLSATKIDFSTYFSEYIDIHHIFPVAWCLRNNVPRSDFDCIINKTPLSWRTNRIVSGDAPSRYLERLKKNAGVSDQEFHSILLTHVVNPEFMQKDDFPGFFRDRKEKILQRIETAMGKTIAREQVIQEEGTVNDSEEETDDDNMTITP